MDSPKRDTCRLKWKAYMTDSGIETSIRREMKIREDEPFVLLTRKALNSPFVPVGRYWLSSHPKLWVFRGE